MLDDERVGSDGAAVRWNGDLHDFTMRGWADDSELAAMVIVLPTGKARGWINIRRVHPSLRPWVWMRLRARAAHRGSDVLLVEEMVALTTGDDRHELAP